MSLKWLFPAYDSMSQAEAVPILPFSRLPGLSGEEKPEDTIITLTDLSFLTLRAKMKQHFLVLSKSFYSLKAVDEINTCTLQHSEKLSKSYKLHLILTLHKVFFSSLKAKPTQKCVLGTTLFLC